jgi:hypothetical protein
MRPVTRVGPQGAGPLPSIAASHFARSATSGRARGGASTVYGAGGEDVDEEVMLAIVAYLASLDP